MKSSGFRQLEERELRYLAHLRERCLARVSLVSVATALWTLVLASGLILGGGGRVQSVFVSGWLGAGLGLALVGMAWVLQGWLRARNLERDWARGEVEVLHAAAPRRECVDRLPYSSLILAVNGCLTTRWHTLPVRGVAAPARSAWVDYFRSGSDVDRVRERAMTDEEIVEFGGVLSATDYVPKHALLLTLGVAILLTTSRWAVAIGANGGGEFVLLLGSAIAILTSVAQRVRALRALRQDLASRSLKIVAFANERRVTGLPGVLEYLPRSGRVWSIDQRPAPWRVRADLSDQL
jgi:hypothetical protein